MCINKPGTQHLLIFCQFWALFVLIGWSNNRLFLLWTNHRRRWSLSHPWAQDLSTTHLLLAVLCSNDNANNGLCVSSLTLSSALSKISLSGKAPSKGIHWSKSSCGSDSSALTGTTIDPIGWSHALDNYRDKDTWITTVRVGDDPDSHRGLQLLVYSILTFIMSISSLGLRTRK